MRTSKSLLKTSAAVALVLATCGVVRAADGVIAKLPADALVVAKVANLTQTSNKIAKLAKDLGIDAFVSQLQNPLAGFKAQMHLDKGLNDAGEIGFAYLSPAEGADEQAKADSYVVVLPVSDYAAFLTNFGEAKTEGGVSEVAEPGETGKSLYVADWSGYAAVSPNKAFVAKPASALAVGGVAAKEVGRQDFVLYANFKKLSPIALAEFDKASAEALTKIESTESKEVDAKYKPLVKSAVGQFFAVAKTFLTDADAATVGLNISDAGLNTTVLSDFKPNSYLANFASSLKGTDKPLTVGLPALKMLVYGGSTFEPGALSKVVDDLIGPVKAEALKIEGHEDVKKIATAFETAVKGMTGSSFGVPVTTKIGQEPLFQQINVARGNGADMKAAADGLVAFGKQAIADMKQPEAGNKPTLEAVANAKSIEGVSFDSVKIDIRPPAGAPNAVQAEQMLGLLYGPGGAATYQYGVSGKDFLMVTGAPDDVTAAFIKSVKANEDNLSKLDQVKVVVAELPKNRTLEYYVQLDEIVNVGVSAAAQFGVPVQIQLPPELPPLGITFGSDSTGLRLDSHLPTATVQSLIAAGMQAFAAMRGGGGNL